MQAEGAVPIVPGHQEGQRLPVRVHEFIYLAERRSVLKPHFDGAFVEQAACRPAAATGFDGFQVDASGHFNVADSFGSHVEQPVRTRFVRFRPGRKGVPFPAAHQLDDVCPGFAEYQGIRNLKILEDSGEIRLVEGLEEHFDLSRERHDRTAQHGVIRQYRVGVQAERPFPHPGFGIHG